MLAFVLVIVHNGEAEGSVGLGTWFKQQPSTALELIMILHLLRPLLSGVYYIH